MAHIHGVIDMDKHFVIDAATREITNQSEKITLMQNDHNSERFTFEIPKEIDGHDMSLCNVVQVHYLNIDASTKAQNPGLYNVKDLQISSDDEAAVIGSWLISANATKYVGSLSFIIRFLCVAEDGTIEYAWNTAIYKGISIGSGINATDAVAEEYADIFIQWQARIEAFETDLVENTKARHTHNNKAVLDILTPEVMAEFDDTVSKRHEHKNKDLLDLFRTSMVDAASFDYNGKMVALYSHVTNAASNLRKNFDEKIAEISGASSGGTAQIELFNTDGNVFVFTEDGNSFTSGVNQYVSKMLYIYFIEPVEALSVGTRIAKIEIKEAENSEYVSLASKCVDNGFPLISLTQEVISSDYGDIIFNGYGIFGISQWWQDLIDYNIDWYSIRVTYYEN